MAATPLQRLLRQGSVYTISTAVQLSGFALVSPFVTRVLTPAEFGLMTTALIVVQILTFVAAVGMPNAIAIEYFDERGGIDASRSLMIVGGCSAFLITLIADLTGPIWTGALFGQIEYDTAIRLAVWSAVPMSIVMCGQSILRSALRPGRFVVVTLAATIVAQGGGLAAVVFISDSAGGFLAGYISILCIAAGLSVALSGVGWSRITDLRLLRRSFALGLPTVPHLLAMYLLVAGDRIVIERTLGLGGVAEYQVAYLVGALGISLAAAVNNAWSPLVYGADRAVRWRILRDTERSLLALGGLAVWGLALLSPIAIAILAPASYDRPDLVPVAAIVAGAAVPYLIYLGSTHVILLHRKAWALAIISPTVALLNLALNAVLIPRHGLIGSAWATVIAYLTLAALAAFAQRRIVPLHRSRVALLAALTTAATGMAAGALLPIGSFGLVSRVGLAAVIAVVALMLSRRWLGNDGEPGSVKPGHV